MNKYSDKLDIVQNKLLLNADNRTTLSNNLLSLNITDGYGLRWDGTTLNYFPEFGSTNDAINDDANISIFEMALNLGQFNHSVRRQR